MTWTTVGQVAALALIFVGLALVLGGMYGAILRERNNKDGGE